MDVWAWLWIAWIGAFLIIEAVAIRRKEPGDTLSEKVWSWFSLRGDKDTLERWQVVLRFGFLAFWAWLTIHFLSGGRFL